MYSEAISKQGAVLIAQYCVDLLSKLERLDLAGKYQQLQTVPIKQGKGHMYLFLLAAYEEAEPQPLNLGGDPCINTGQDAQHRNLWLSNKVTAFFSSQLILRN